MKELQCKKEEEESSVVEPKKMPDFQRLISHYKVKQDARPDSKKESQDLKKQLLQQFIQKQARGAVSQKPLDAHQAERPNQVGLRLLNTLYKPPARQTENSVERSQHTPRDSLRERTYDNSKERAPDCLKENQPDRAAVRERGQENQRERGQENARERPHDKKQLNESKSTHEVHFAQTKPAAWDKIQQEKKKLLLGAQLAKQQAIPVPRTPRSVLQNPLGNYSVEQNVIAPITIPPLMKITVKAVILDRYLPRPVLLL